MRGEHSATLAPCKLATSGCRRGIANTVHVGLLGPPHHCDRWRTFFMGFYPDVFASCEPGERNLDTCPTGDQEPWSLPERVNAVGTRTVDPDRLRDDPRSTRPRGGAGIRNMARPNHDGNHDGDAMVETLTKHASTTREYCGRQEERPSRSIRSPDQAASEHVP